ncbi:adenosylcobinamide-phosphate synthase CbiB [Afifella marina]|uniref:Cobalamin biosynthesis protein CobD n=1 Tax=Afifella marina DSM 2698 TaxID=1120955 RepID=A0A1G5P769_AFIMA|nr:adenosylcobinamide-phosphate synthase CbiB [Afifella marina]MBK1624888.1 cobalamin biosynthesis protein [Afifella marina DSM 2698]MBK1628482.1 cobalamin biosynthesis protein [Afifella marina]MBK5917969.1 adenosylcobinamide-phosphate synthase [Afifella marina]RAI18695.1 adenosylcobinamide-phosphate synthase [Afifella marina DSM 2698]SCZ45407.1 adenosylcobinamide-phosphate synthase [Afifella marina DSM 2698]
MSRLVVLALGLLIDRLVGDPDELWKKIGHPVAWIGRLIEGLDQGLNDERKTGEERRKRGMLAVAVLIGLAVFAGVVLQRIATALPLSLIVEALIVSVFLAQKSLLEHVQAVGDAMAEGGIGPARKALSWIVGRDVTQLDEAGVNRAALESLAENFSDGLVAPAFWYLIGGLPGLLAYKALNTADSMIGHKNERYQDFGYAAARLDDLANYVPARLSALLIAAAAAFAEASPRQALKAARRDAPLHRSPNAGWPEAALAGALGLAFGGPRRYGNEAVEGAWLNAEGRSEATLKDLRRGLRLADATWLLGLALVAVSALLIWG